MKKPDSPKTSYPKKFVLAVDDELYGRIVVSAKNERLPLVTFVRQVLNKNVKKIKK